MGPPPSFETRRTQVGFTRLAQYLSARSRVYPRSGATLLRMRADQALRAAPRAGHAIDGTHGTSRPHAEEHCEAMRLEAPQVGFTRLAHLRCRSRVNPRSV